MAALSPGEQYAYTFDLGDRWTHRCTIGDESIEPYEVLAVVPDRPLAYWGWGTLPDPHGRRLFWVVDNGSSHAGLTSVQRMREAQGSARAPADRRLVAQPGRDLLLDRSAQGHHADFADLTALERRLLGFEAR